MEPTKDIMEIPTRMREMGACSVWPIETQGPGHQDLGEIRTRSFYQVHYTTRITLTYQSSQELPLRGGEVVYHPPYKRPPTPIEDPIRKIDPPACREVIRLSHPYTE